MTIVMLEPHHDDIALFAAYTAMRCQPVVITVFGDVHVQEQYGITAEVRELESVQAMKILDATSWSAWNFDDRNDFDTPVGQIANRISHLVATYAPMEVWAPLHEDGGHVQHNLVARALAEALGEGDPRTRHYATYRRGEGRTQTATEVEPNSGERARKMLALSCYASQIDLWNTRPWFVRDFDREWIA